MGRQAMGSNAVGRRTLFGLPTAAVRAKINLLSREFSTVVCTVEATTKLFHTEQPLWSPTGALAARAVGKLRGGLETYSDGTVAIHTVEQRSNPWLHAVLRSLGRERRGLLEVLSPHLPPSLQSVNIPRGLVRDLHLTLRLLCNPFSPVSHLVLDKYLFSKPCCPKLASSF
eukprot:RCo033406